MNRLSFETSETLIYDPVASNRNATRASLHALGFRQIETVANLEGLAERLQRQVPDLILCDALGAASDLCSLIQKFRQDMSAYNPFVVVIVTAFDKGGALVNQVINSGADDLILRPFSAAVLGQRIGALVERRKNFVITSDYVGPDRRRDATRPSNVELFEPPNSLKMKAKERLSADAAAQRMGQELRVAKDAFLAEKIRRDSFQIMILWRLMRGEGPAFEDHRFDLSQIIGIAKSIARRSKDSPYAEAADRCESIIAALGGMSAGVDSGAAMQLLGQAAMGLHRLLNPEKTQDVILREIEATVAIIRARGLSPRPAVAAS